MRSGLFTRFNNSIRCIEILLLHDELNPENQFNNNIRCIEMNINNHIIF